MARMFQIILFANCQPKISHIGRIGVLFDQNVGRLDVAVNQSPMMRMLQSR